MIKDKKEKSGGSKSNAAGTSSSSSTATSASSSKTTNSNSKANKINILGIKEEIIEGNSEQLIVTSIKHEDGSPPTNIIKKEPVNQSTASTSSGSSSSAAANDSNNNNDAKDPLSTAMDDKDGVNNDSLTDELLNSEELTGGSSNLKMGPGGMLNIKSEDNAEMSADNSLNNNFVQMNASGGPGSGGSCRMMNQQSPERIQPLPSNVVNKQSNSMEYMQQQSQIFVFSTALANKGAESVLGGHFQSIIAYHCAQPGTKKFLEKYPLKLAQFNRQGHPWMNIPAAKNKNMRMNPQQQQIPPGANFMMKNNPQQHPNQMPPQQQPGGPFSQSCDMWPNQMDPLGPNSDMLTDPLGLNSDLVPEPQMGGNGPNSNQQPPHQSPGTCNMDPTSPNIPSLQGVKVPDENLTPQQLHSRELKLARLNQLQKLVFREQTMNPDCQMGDQDQTPQQGPGTPQQQQQQNQQGQQQLPGQGPPGPNNAPSGGNPCAKMSMSPQMNPNQMNPAQMQQMQNPGMSPNMGPGMMGNGPMNNQIRPNFMNMGGPRPGMNPNMCRPPMQQMGGPNNGGMNDGMMSGMGSPEMCGPNMQMGPGGPPGNPNQMGMMGMNMHQMQQQQGGNMNPMNMNNMGSCQMPNQMGGMMGGPKGMPGPPQQNMMGPNQNMQAQLEWQKLQHQYFEENKRKGMMNPQMDMNDHPGNCMLPGGRQMPPGMPPNMRNPRGQQGPPPPYHQTPRSASVPIATQSPNPNSPNNPTSNLSLPSPRGVCNSSINSPAAGNDPGRPMNPQQQQAFKHMNARQSPTMSQDSPAGMGGRQMSHNSNPSTPISAHLSPNASLDLGPCKEATLMPVPSPQQISYFDAPELKIQKQPNTNLQDGSSSGGNPGNMNLQHDNRLPGQKTPTSQPPVNSQMNPFPIPSSPHTPGSAPPNSGEKNRIGSGPSPGLQRSNSLMGNEFSHGNNQSLESNMQPFSDSPSMPFGPNSQQSIQQQQQQQQNAVSGPGNPNKMGPEMGNNGPPFPCGGRPENLPLNPNSSTVPIAKPSHFDPISSLAQMSQQLTSNAGGALNGQPQGPQGNPNMMGGFVQNNNGMMTGIPDMGLGNMDAGMGGMGPNSMEYGIHPSQYGMGQMPGPPRPMSPKIGGAMPNQMGGFPGPNPMSRMMNRPPGMNPYNGTSIQVKPSAPNTIQYLPARPQVSNTNPRGPPSLEFLQRFANPMNMEEMKPGNQQQMPFFPNQQNSGMNPNMNPGMMDEPGMMNPNMMRGMRGNNHQMMRFPGPGNGGNHCMMGGGGGNNTFNNPNMEQMFPGQPNPGMSFVPKGSPGPMQMNPNQVPTSNSMNNMNSMNSMNGPEQMQQQMQMNGPGGPGHHFQKQQYSGGGPGADPNYAQQYHNFQQQLYATNNSRNQMMGGPPQHQQQQFIMPK